MNKYIFICPIHGYENQCFCFRAFQLENKHLWRKIKYSYHVIENKNEQKELEKFIKELQI